MSPSAVRAMLHYGYVPSAPPESMVEAWEAASIRDEIVADDEALVSRGTEALAAGFDVEDDGLHVIPLSGGLDSRVILGFLAERVGPERIVTVTVGVPGAWDYECAVGVARAAGVRHERIDLTAHDFSVAPLLRSARGAGVPLWIFGRAFLDLVQDRFGRDAIYWSGFFGDPVAGSHLIDPPSEDWATARARFARRNCIAPDEDLSEPGYDPITVLPDEPWFAPGRLTLDEQIDFLVRQESYIRPTVVPVGFDVRLPFLAPRWREFIVAVPRPWRFGQRLYRRILERSSPRLHSLPTKADFGHSPDAPRWRKRATWLRVGLAARVRRWSDGRFGGIDPRMNYVDWDAVIREDARMRASTEALLGSLEERGVVPWLDVAGLLDDHLRRRRRNGQVITLLVSLELALQAGDEVGHG